MKFRGDAPVVAALEDRHDVRARAREARDLKDDGVTETQVTSRNDGPPPEPLGGAFLADGAGHDRVSLGTQLVDRLHGIEADGALGAAVVVHVAVRIALEPERGYPRRGHRRLQLERPS